MAKEKNYVVAPGKAISCKNGVIGEGEAISWRNMPDPLSRKGQEKLDEAAVGDLKKNNFKALLNSDKILVVEKKEPYVPPEVTEPPVEPSVESPKDPAPKDEKEPAGGAKRKKKKE